MGIAGRAVQTDELVSIGGTPSSGTTQTALNAAVTVTSAATTKARALAGAVTLPDAVFTCTNVISVEAQNASKGASATITNQHGVFVNDQTQGTNNYGVTSQVYSGTNKWNIYASGTADNYFAGDVGIGTTTPTNLLEVSATSAGANSFLARFKNAGTTTATQASLLLTTNTNAGGTASSQISSVAENATGAVALTFGNTANGSNPTEKMRIDSSGNVGIGTSSPNASAILDAQSTTKGVRMPNMTTTQKNAISSPAAGLMVFDTTLAKLCVYSGSAWQTITSV
jgi:hypothetical protein